MGFPILVRCHRYIESKPWSEQSDFDFIDDILNYIFLNKEFLCSAIQISFKIFVGVQL